MNGMILVTPRPDLQPRTEKLFVGEEKQKNTIVQIIDNSYRQIDKECLPRITTLDTTLIDLLFNIQEGDIYLLSQDARMVDVTDYYKIKCARYEDRTGVHTNVPEKVYAVSIHDIIY